MPVYTPPLHDMMFVLSSVIGLSHLPPHPDLGAFDEAVVQSILEPAAALAGDVLAPLNHAGDKAGLRLEGGRITMPAGFKDAYDQYRDGGWNAVPFSQDHGGQGLPWLIAFAVQEMWQGANMAFGLCPLLNQGAIEAIEAHASEDLKARYLGKLISGEWTGTMNLTEPQAGSDLAAVRTKATRETDGTYRIFGQKIYITYGEHDLAENIIHLVLARLPDAPEGVKGISLFIVPKFLDDGTRNDVICTGIEHKLGIHASPTCTMQFGDQGGAVGYLVGQEHEGLKYMFTMMNNARLSVGLQGVAIAEAAYQAARDYAYDRVQGTSLSDKSGTKVAIIHHPDVKRMILLMAAQIEAGRVMTYSAAANLDRARGGDVKAQARVDLLTPIVKAWCTDMAVRVTSIGIQIHGGMGFVEETGAAQFYRDARILPIYEGTNGIQAADLVFRKILRDQGAALNDFIADSKADIDSLSALPGDDMAVIHDTLQEAAERIEQASAHLFVLAKEGPDFVATIAAPYLDGIGTFAGGVMMARAARIAVAALHEGGDKASFFDQKIIHARIYAEHILPGMNASLQSVLSGAKTVVSASISPTG